MPGRVQLSWTLAGGVLAGGLLVVLATVTGTMSTGLALYSTSIFCLMGAVVGGVHGLALGVVGRPLQSGWRQTASSLALGTLAVVPGILLAWVAALSISLTPISLSLDRPLLVVPVILGWIVGLSICVWAALEGYAALRNALLRWPEARSGAPLIAGVFVMLLALSLGADAEALAVPVSRWTAVLLATLLTLWIAVPGVVLGIHLVKRVAEPMSRRSTYP